MEFQLNSLTFPLIFSVLLLFAAASAETETGTGTETPTTNPFDFIRSSCNATLYPEVCFTSLSRYATYVRTDPAQLARIAIGVTLVRARHALSAISNVTRRADYEPDHRVASAAHDCASLFGDAVDQMRGSLRQMGRLRGSSGAEAVRFQLSNVQTWMSAALTNEDTCTDGFADVEDCPVKVEVCDSVGSVKEFTSNALALVNSFAASVGS